MDVKDVDNKIPIYKLETKEKILDFYINWTQKNQYDQDMVEWNYVGPKNAAKMFSKYAHNKSINILDAGCGGCPEYYGIINMYKDVKYTGMDITPKLVEYNNSQNIDCVYGSLK